MPSASPQISNPGLWSPRAAGFTGILFALLFGASYILIQMAMPAITSDAGRLTEDQVRLVTFGLSFLPFAGIAFFVVHGCDS